MEIWVRTTVVEVLKRRYDLKVMFTGFGARFEYRKTKMYRRMNI